MTSWWLEWKGQIYKVQSLNMTHSDTLLTSTSQIITEQEAKGINKAWKSALGNLFHLL